MFNHVHTRTCDMVATIKYLLDGQEKEWTVGAYCTDTADTLKRHLAKYIPQATFISVTFESAHP